MRLRDSLVILGSPGQRALAVREGANGSAHLFGRFLADVDAAQRSPHRNLPRHHLPHDDPEAAQHRSSVRPLGASWNGASQPVVASATLECLGGREDDSVHL